MFVFQEENHVSCLRLHNVLLNIDSNLPSLVSTVKRSPWGHSVLQKCKLNCSYRSQCHGTETSELQTLIHIDMLFKCNGSNCKNIRSLVRLQRNVSLQVMATCGIWKKDNISLGCEIWNGQFHKFVSTGKYGSSIKHMKTLVFLWCIHLVFIAAVRQLCVSEITNMICQIINTGDIGSDNIIT